MERERGGWGGGGREGSGEGGGELQREKGYENTDTGDTRVWAGR